MNAAGIVLVLVVGGAIVAAFVLRMQASTKQRAGLTTIANDSLARLAAALERSGALDGRLAAEPWEEVRGHVFDVRLRVDSALMSSSDPALRPTLETLSRATTALLEQPADADPETAARATTQFCETARLVRPLLPPAMY